MYGEVYRDAPTIPDKVHRAFQRMEDMTPDMRLCIQEFGSVIVFSCIQAGVTDPTKIRTLVNSIWMGAREPMQNQGTHIKYSPVFKTLDALLMNSGSSIGALTLLRILKLNHMVIIPIEPSTVMVDASVEAVRTIGTVTTKQKHQHRLRCAIRAQVKRLWPHLFEGEF